MTEIFDSLGWALLHSLWQGALAMLIVVIFRANAKKLSPSLRYNVQFFLLLACFAAFFVTFGLYQFGGMTGTGLPSLGQEGKLATDTAGLLAASGGSSQLSSLNLTSLIANSTPLLGLFWCIGFFFVAAKYLAAYSLTQKMRHTGITNVPVEWQNRFRTLVLNNGLSERVKLYISYHVTGPLTIGFIRPVVLVPAGFLSGLPADQVEAILLHELAHIRRYDYLINLLQTAIKTVFFFHPAIHYISKRIDIDREQACDDLAVAQTRNPRALAFGLAALRLKMKDPTFAMAAENGETPLMDRLNRLAGSDEYRRRPAHLLMPLLMPLALTLLMGGFYVSSATKANANPEVKTAGKMDKASTKHEDMSAWWKEDQETEAKSKYKRTKSQAKHDAYNGFRETLYGYLLQDGVIQSDKETVTLSLVNDQWAANGKVLTDNKDGKYCKLISGLDVRKSKIKKVVISPKSTHVVSVSQSGKDKQTHKVTYGEFHHDRTKAEQKSDLVKRIKYTPNEKKASNRAMPAFGYPVKTPKITAKYGQKGELWKIKHQGMDFKGQTGDAVLASLSGVVRYATQDKNWGKYIVIDHENGYQTLYAHMDSLAAKKGQSVGKGDQIGAVGSTGKSTGPHLHFEIRRKGERHNPQDYLPRS